MRILLGMPCMKNIPFKTVISLLQTAKQGVVEPYMIEGSLVYDSREAIAKFAIQRDYDYILYVDSDMVFGPDDLKKLVSHNADICSGLYVSRRGDGKNILYTDVTTRRRFPKRSAKLVNDTLDTGYGEIAACGFGFCLIKCDVIKTMYKKYKALFEPFKGVGEDIAFCIRAKKCGYKIFTDRDVKIGHIGDMVYGDRV